MWEKHTSDGGRHMWEKRLFFFLMLIIRLDNLRVRVYLPGGGGVRFDKSDREEESADV